MTMPHKSYEEESGRRIHVISSPRSCIPGCQDRHSAFRLHLYERFNA